MKEGKKRDFETFSSDLSNQASVQTTGSEPTQEELVASLLASNEFQARSDRETSVAMRKELADREENIKKLRREKAELEKEIFFRHIMAGESEAVKKMLEIDPSLLCTRDKKGATPLHYACARNHLGLAGILLEYDKDNKLLNSVNHSGETALHVAIDGGFANLVKFLLAMDNDNTLLYAKDHVEYFGYNSLLLACHNGFEEIVPLLLEKDQDNKLLYSIDDEGFNTVHLACNSNSYGIAKLLLAKDQESRLLNGIMPSDGSSALHLACANMNKKLVKLFLERDDENNTLLKLKTKNGFSALHIAIIKGDLETAKLLAARSKGLLRDEVLVDGKKLNVFDVAVDCSNAGEIKQSDCNVILQWLFNQDKVFFSPSASKLGFETQQKLGIKPVSTIVQTAVVANSESSREDLNNARKLCSKIIEASRRQLNLRSGNENLDKILKASTSNSINVVLDGMKTFLTTTAGLYGVNLSNFGVNLQPSKQLEEIQNKFTLDLNSFVFTR